MDTYFNRHTKTLDISAATRKRLWDERIVAIHYPVPHKDLPLADADFILLDPADYHGHARHYLRALLRLAAEGGYVLAEYYGSADFLVGKVPAGSQVEILEGEWGSRPRVALLKALRLHDARVLSRLDHAVITANRPRQGTISRWHAVGDAVAAIVEGRAQPQSWGMLSTARQELGCSEFLRLPDAAGIGLPRLRALLLPVGRTLKDVDIVGIDGDGGRIFAQVTSSTAEHAKANGKLDALRPYVLPGSCVVLFCNCEEPFTEGGVRVIPVEAVFRTLDGSEWGRRFLRGVA